MFQFVAVHIADAFINHAAGGLRDQPAHAAFAASCFVTGAGRDQAVDGGRQGVDAGFFDRHRLDDWNVVPVPTQLEHVFQLIGGPLGQRQIGLVDHQHVGDLEHAGFHRLHVIAHVGCVHHHADVGNFGDLDFRLSGADRLQDDAIAAGDVHHVDNPVDALRQPAQMAARRH